MNRVYNFSAGPSMLPIDVLNKAAAELVCYGESGMSVMEMSHRSKEYQAILNSGNINKYSLLKIYNVYLLRVLNVFKDSGYYLKISRQEMIYIKESFGVHFQEMKQVANLLLAIQQDFIVLIKNLH